MSNSALVLARGSLLRLALALTAVSGLGGCLPAYETRLKSMRGQGEHAQADRLLAAAEARDPENPAILRERAILAFERRDNEEAIRLLERALTLAPEDGRAALYIAAASERAGRLDESLARYRRVEALWADSPELRVSPELGTDLTCQRRALDARRLSALVKSKLAGDPASPPPRRRILFLPMTGVGGSEVGLNLRLGLAELLATDWERAPATEPVPFEELLAFLNAIDAPLDAPIDAELRERLADLTGARFVVEGTLSEHSDVVSVAAILIDREGEGSREQRIEYQQSRVATLIELEKKLLFRLTAALAIALTPAQQNAMSEFATQSGLAVVLYGEALRLIEKGDPQAAAERLNRAVGLDPGFRAAREKQLDLTLCHSVAGEPERLLQNYEMARLAAEEDARQRMLLSDTTRESGRLGGPEGEGGNLSLNRPLGAGSVSIPVQLPR